MEAYKEYEIYSNTAKVP